MEISEEKLCFSEALLTVGEHQIYTSRLQPSNPRPDNLTVLILHGAGTADSSRHDGLAEMFARQGVAVLSLDFLGHGKSPGGITDGNLDFRIQCALSAVRHWTDDATPLVLCGFSMSGHVALRLSVKLGSRVKSLGLFCPATYAAEAESVNFGPEFTKIIRVTDSWKSSPALQDATEFNGRAAIVMGAHDDVIPWEVVSQTARALAQNATNVRLEVVGGVRHLLAAYLSGNPGFSEPLVEYLIGNQA